ncbi:hypothetical protein [Nocardioides sambongensis]|uniref:hypothetical protein n=1 Tax=Nocardioides sambongensis TaxID=2589074 RepID=UPI00112AFB1F|nr:hypothetical protein [Nocardioides sambongensis]
MHTADAAAISNARTHLATLADTATNLDASLAYEHTLLYLDTAYADNVPALDTAFQPVNPETLHNQATDAITDLADHGLDPLQVELLHALLNEARAHESSSDTSPEC